MKRHSISSLPLYLVIVLIAGCATTLDVPADERTKVFDVPYPKTFQAVIQVLSEEGYLIENTDRENGVISTDYSEITHRSGVFAGRDRTKVSAVIRELNTGTQIRLTISVQSQDSTGWDAARMNKTEARSYYNKLFEKIGSRLAEY